MGANRRRAIGVGKIDWRRAGVNGSIGVSALLVRFEPAYAASEGQSPLNGDNERIIIDGRLEEN